MRFPVKVFSPLRVMMPVPTSTFKAPDPLMVPVNVRLPIFPPPTPIVPCVFSVMLFERV